MTVCRPTPGWTLLGALCSLCTACGTFATVALVGTPDGSPEATDAKEPRDAVASMDAAPGEDAAALLDGGAAIAPSPDGSLACGAFACDLSYEICCTCPNCLIPFPTECFPSFPGCEPATTYSPLACGSSANCPDQISCCASFSDAGLTGASCRRACASTDVQLCASDSECPGETACRALASIPGFMGCE